MQVLFKVWNLIFRLLFIFIMNIFQSILFWKHQSYSLDFVFNKLVYGYGKWDVISHHAHLFKVNCFSIVLIDSWRLQKLLLVKGYFESARMWRERESHLSNWAILLVRFQNPWCGVHFPLWIFFARTIDRFGKGLRTEKRHHAFWWSNAMN
jgi:hypothetical protein